MENLFGFYRRMACHGPNRGFEKFLFFCLLPLGRLYGLIGGIRVFFYRAGIFPVFQAGVPVISVGNLSVGGTGKTPVVDYLVKFFLGQGKKVAVVSRGYGVPPERGVKVVSIGEGPVLPAAVCGDEPFLLARRNPRASVYVAPRRREGVRAAVSQGAEIIILDDGFQHLAVGRDLDIVLLDGRCPLGNGQVLPAGLLREFPRALRRGDLFLLTRWGMNEGSQELALPGPVLRSRHILADTCVSLRGEEVPVTALADRKFLAFAGIADPGGFFADLAEKGAQPQKVLHFPDHAAYDVPAIQRILESLHGMDCLVTTEKDAAKLEADQFPVPCFQVPLKLDLLDKGLLESILRKFI